MCARLDQVRAWPQRGSGTTKCQRTWIRCALAGRGSHAHFRPERLHARSLCRRCTHSSQPCTGRISSDRPRDRKSTRLNSSHTVISYAVFCLKKKKNQERNNEK